MVLFCQVLGIQRRWMLTSCSGCSTWSTRQPCWSPSHKSEAPSLSWTSTTWDGHRLVHYLLIIHEFSLRKQVFLSIVRRRIFIETIPLPTYLVIIFIVQCNVWKILIKLNVNIYWILICCLQTVELQDLFTFYCNNSAVTTTVRVP